MSTAKKAMLAVLLALTTVCAAVCSLLLAGSVSARAEMSQEASAYESLTINTDALASQTVYAGHTLDNLKPYLVVTAHDAEGESDTLADSEYTLAVQDGGEIVVGSNTIVATINGGTASGTFDVEAVAATSQPTAIKIVMRDSNIYSTASDNDIINRINYAASRIYFGDVSYPLTNYLRDIKIVYEKSLLPEASEVTEEGGSYTRNVYFTYTEEGKTARSEAVPLTVEWDKPSRVIIRNYPVTFTAGSAVPNDEFEVAVSYTLSGAQTTLTSSQFKVRYYDNPEIPDDRTDVIEFGDPELYIIYTEGGIPFEATLDISFLPIIEEPIQAPTTEQYAGGTKHTSTYDSELQTWDFTRFNNSQMKVDVNGVEVKDTNTADSLIAFNATDAGTYTVTFRVKDGFQFLANSILSGGQIETEMSGAGEEIITAVTYTWEILQAELTDVSFELTGEATEWTYDGKSENHAPTNLVAKGVGSEADGIDLGSAGSGEDGKVVYTYNYAGKPNTGSSWAAGISMPTDGGEYTVNVTLSGMKNYKDYTTSAEKGNQISFTINRASVALPTIPEADKAIPFDGDRHSPTVTDNDDSSLYDTLNEKKTNAGKYTITFTLHEKHNYYWEGQTKGEAVYTIDWEITQAENTLTFTVQNGVYNGAKIVLTPDYDFGSDGDIMYVWQYRAYGTADGEWTPYSGDPRTDANPNAGYYRVQGTMKGTNDYTQAVSAWTDAEIARAEVNRPELSGWADFVYNGESKSPVVPTNPGYTQSGGTLSAEDAGEYTVTFTLTDNYRWSGEENESTSRTHSATWQIKRAVFVKPELDDDTFVYSSGVTVNISGYIIGYVEGESPYELSGDTSKTDAGNYAVTLTLNANYCTQASEQTDFTEKQYTYKLDWFIQRQGVAKPTDTDAQEYTYEEGSEFQYKEENPAYSVTSKAQTNAGKYDVVFELDPNYCWGADGSEDLATYPLENGLIILRSATVKKPTMDATATYYTGEPQTKAVDGYDSLKMRFDLGAAGSEFKDNQLTATDAGTYTITFTITDNNYTWSEGGQKDPESSSAEVKFSWEIERITNVIEYPDPKPDFKGWAFGTTPKDPAAVMQASAKYDGKTPEYKIYAAADVAFANPIDLKVDTPQGNYILRVSIGNGRNTYAVHDDIPFTITPGEAEIKDITLEGGEDWTYGDPLAEHALSYSVWVNDLELEVNQELQVQYFTKGWSGDGADWGDPVVDFGQYSDAGYYKIVITIADDASGNYLGAKDETTTFTIEKYLVSVPIPSEQEREKEYKAGEKFKPDMSCKDPMEGLEWIIRWEEGYPFENKGIYWAYLTLTNTNNFAWDESSFFSSTAAGVTDGYDPEGQKNTVKVWYRIRSASYTEMNLRISLDSWKYGTTPAEIEFNKPADVAFTEVEFTFYKGTAQGGSMSGLEELSEGFCGSDGNIAAENWPKPAGDYTLLVLIPQSQNFDACPGIVTFTIEKAELVLTANEAQAIYGTDPTAIDWKDYRDVRGLVDGDDLATVLKDVTFKYEAENYGVGSPVARYNITMTTEGGVKEVANYTLKLQTATEALNITPRPLTGNIQNPTELTYSGKTIPATFKPTNAVGEDKLEFEYTYYKVGGGKIEGEPKDVGSYYVTVALASGGIMDNYTFEGESSVDDPYTIAPRKLTPEWGSLLHTYGNVAGATVSFEGQYGEGDNYESLLLTWNYEPTAGTEYAGEGVPVNAGTYTVTITLGNQNYCFGGSEGIYEYTSSKETYTIKKAELTLTANPVEVTYGDLIDTDLYGFDHSELFNDDEIKDVLAGIDLVYWSGVKDNKEYSAGDPVNGTYIVTIKNAFDLPNYNVLVKDGVLTVLRRELTMQIDNPTGQYLIYDGEAIKPTFTPKNVYNGDKPVFEYTYYKVGSGEIEGEPKDVGSYYVTVALASGGIMDNYTFAGASSESTPYTIVPRKLTPEWGSLQHTYGNVAGATVSFEGQYGAGDNYESLLLAWYYDATAGTEYAGEGVPKNAGTYTVTITLGNKNYCFGEDAGIYEYTSSNETYKIDKAELILKANNAQAIYGTAPGDDIGWKGYSDVRGLVNGDKLATVLKGVDFTYTAVDYAAGDPVGDYNVTLEASVPEVANYRLDYEVAKNALKIIPRPIIVDIKYQSAEYGTKAEEMNGALAEEGASGVRAASGEYYGLFADDVGKESEIWSLEIYEEDRADGTIVSGIPKAANYYIYGVQKEEGLGKNYEVTFFGQEALNDGYDAPNRAFFVIGQRSVSISLSAVSDDPKYLIYNRQGKKFDATLETPGVQLDFIITYWEYDADELTATEEPPVNYGHYWVKATIKDADDANNYTLGDGARTHFWIQKATYSWVTDVLTGGFETNSIVYDGTVHEPKLENEEMIGGGLDPEYPVKPTYTATTLTGEPTVLKNAGVYNYKAEFTVTSPNYEAVAPVTGRIEIEQYTLEAKDITWSHEGEGFTFVYNGDTQIGSVSATFKKHDAEGNMTGTDYPLTIKVRYGESAFRNVGEYTFVVEGVDDSNYTVAANVTQRYWIERYSVKIKASDHDHPLYYGDDIPAFTWEYVGANQFFESDSSIEILVGGYNGEALLTPGIPVGPYVTRIRSITADAGVLENYTINGEDGEAWRLWWRDTRYEGKVEISQRLIALEQDEMSLPTGVSYTGDTYSAFVQKLEELFSGDSLRELEFIYTYSGRTVAGKDYLPTEEAPAEAGEYTVTVTLAAEGGKNANYKLTKDSFEFSFSIATAELTGVAAEGRQDIEFDNAAYYFLEEDDGSGRALLLASHTATAVDELSQGKISWTFSLTDGEFGSGFAIRFLTEVNEFTDGVSKPYTVYYRVSAPNHEDKTGSFEVTICRTDNEWKRKYSHSGWAYKGDGTPYNPAFTQLIPMPAPESKFGTEDVTYTYYETRTGDAGAYQYSDVIADPDSFFNNDTPAGTYYVLVSVAGTKNYSDITYDGTIVVAQHTLSLRWEHSRLTAADQEEITQNTIDGYDTSIMEYVSAVGLTDVTPEEGRITAGVVYVVGSYSVTVRLTDSNYCWDSSIIDPSNAVNAIIRFTVSELENEVAIAISGDWTYGDNVTVDIVVGPTPAEGYTIAVAVSSILGGEESANANVAFTYARHVEGTTEETAASLRYSTEMPTDAGTYWICVTVTGEDSYGTGTGYKQFIIHQRTLADPELSSERFEYKGSVQTYKPQFGEDFEISGSNVLYTLPNGRQETVAVISGNVYINAGSYRASVALQDKENYVWADNGAADISFDWSIAKKMLTAPVFAEKEDEGGSDTLNTVYDPEVNSWLLSGFDPSVMGIQSATNAYYTLVGGSPAIVASDVGEHTLVINIQTVSGGIYNYYWENQEPTEDGGTVVLTWQISPFVYTASEIETLHQISFDDASKEYNGQVQSIAIAGELPEWLRVEYSAGVTDVTSEPVVITATFSSASGNYVVDPENNTLTAELTVTQKILSEGDLVWSGESSSYTFAYTNSSQLGKVTVSFMGVSGRRLPVPVAIAGYTPVEGTDGEMTDFVNAGTYTFGLDYDAFEYNNYKLPDGAVREYTISRRSVTVYIGDQFETYNGAPHAATSDTRDYLVAGDSYYQDFTETLALALFWRGEGAENGDGTFTDAGKYDIRLSEESKAALSVNYDVQEVWGEFTVEKAQLSVRVDESGHIYGSDALGTWNSEIEDGQIFAADEGYVFTLALATAAQDSEGVLYIAPAGTYYIEYQLGDRASNYEISFNGVIAEADGGDAAVYIISPREVTVTVAAPDGLVYGEEGESVEYTDNLLERDKNSNYIVLTYAGTSFGGETYSDTVAPTNAGNYTVTASLSEECKNYVLAADSFLTDGYAIAKASVATPEQTNDLYYNEDVQEPVFAEDSRYSHGEIAQQKDAGTYSVQFTLTDEANNNYAWANGDGSAVLNVSWTIRQATAEQYTVDWGGLRDWQYDGKAHTPEGTVKIKFANGQTVEVEAYRYQYALVESEVYGTEPYANAGSYKVRVYIYETSNFEAKSSDAVEYTVEKGVYDLSRVELNDGSAYYNGSAHVLSIVGSLPVGEDGIAVQVTYSYAIGDAPYDSMIDAGVYTVTATLSSTSGNYVFGESNVRTAQFTVLQASAQIVWNIEDGFEYDGEEHSYSATYRNVNGIDVPLDVTIVDGEAYKNAGDYTFNAEFATEAEKRNYKLDDDTTERSIAARTVSVQFGNTDFTFDGKAKPVTAELTDEVALADGVTLTQTYAGKPFGNRSFTAGAAAPSMAGNYTVTAALGNANGNFVLAGDSLSFTIAKARVSVPELESKPFNNEEQVADVPEDARYTVSKNDGGIHAGVYTVELLLTNADDYLWYDGAECDGADYALQWSIRQAVYGVDYTIENPVYDGDYVYDNTGKTPTGHATIVFATGGSPIVGSDDADPLTAPIRYAYAVVGSADEVPETGDFIYDRPVNAGIYKVVAFVPATSDYTEGYDLAKASVLVIEKADYDMTGVSLESGAEFTYDGMAHQPALVGTLPTGLDNVRVEVDAYTFTVKDGNSVAEAVDAGTYVATVVFKTSSPNYNEPDPVSAEFTIDAKVLSADDVLWETGNFTYNGTDQIQAVKAYFLNVAGDRVYLKVGVENFIPAGSTAALADTVQFLNAGTYVFAVQATNNGNYIFDEAEKITLVMAQSEITVEIGTGRGVYSGEEPGDVERVAITVTSEDNYFNNDALGIVLEKEAGINVGSYAISIAEWSNANYIIVNAGTAQGTYVIDPKPIEVDVAANAALVYDNTQKAASWDIASGEFVAGEGLEDVTVTLIYSGTANDGSSWYGEQAPVKAGQYTVTVQLAAQNYVLDSAVTPLNFTIERAKLALPTLADSGSQNMSSVETGEWETVLLKGYDSRVMGILSSGLVSMTVDEDGNVSLMANDVGTYTISVYLKDTDNYEWAEQASEPGEPAVANVSMSWTVEDAAESMVWLIATLSGLLVVEIVLLVVAIRRGKKNNGGDGTDEGNDNGDGSGGPSDEEAPAESPDGEMPAVDTGLPSDEAPAVDTGLPADEAPAADAGLADAPAARIARPRAVKMYSFAPLGMLLFVPGGQIGAIAALGAACVVLAVCDIVAFVRSGKKAEEEPVQEQPVEEPVPEPIPEPVAEPVVEIAEEPIAEPEPLPEPEPAPELIAAPELEDDEDERAFALIGADGKVLIRYDYSFRAKLIQAPAEVQDWYGELSDEFLSYAKVKSAESWKQVRFYKGRIPLAIALFKGKKLCIAFALDPNDYEDTKYHGENMSDVKRFAKTPMLLRITSRRRVGYAKYLFAQLAEKYGFIKNEPTLTEHFLPYEPTEQLIEEKLVKVLASDDITDLTQVVKADVGDIIQGDIDLHAVDVSTEAEEVAEPAEEIAAAEATETDDENESDLMVFDEEDEEPDMIMADLGNGITKILIRYNYSFRARLIQSSAEIQSYYGQLIDEIAAYSGLKTKISWRQQRIYVGRKTVAYLLFKGKKLCIALALDPADYSETKYRGLDMSNVKRFAKTPMLLKVVSERKARYAKYLLAEACAKVGLEKGEVVHTEFSLPYRSTPDLIADNLIKVMSSGEGGESIPMEQADISALIRDRITMREAQMAITDEMAESLVEEIGGEQEPAAPEEPAAALQSEELSLAEDGAAETVEAVASAEEKTAEGDAAPEAVRPAAAPARREAVRRDSAPAGKGKRGIVNIDSLSRAFAPNDVVNLETLRKKKIVSPKVTSIKVLARGVLDKPLIVEANDFSMDAVKMILLTGGKVRRIR